MMVPGIHLLCPHCQQSFHSFGLIELQVYASTALAKAQLTELVETKTREHRSKCDAYQAYIDAVVSMTDIPTDLGSMPRGAQ